MLPPILIVVVVLVLILLSFAFLIWREYQASNAKKLQHKKVPKKSSSDADTKPSAPPSAEDNMKYFMKYIHPKMTSLQLLFLVATHPVNLRLTREQLDILEEKTKERLEEEEEKKKKNASTMDMMDLLNDQEWDTGDGGEDGDGGDGGNGGNGGESEAERKQRLADMEKKARTEHVSGKIPIEGVDKGVLGQEWVERQLTLMKVWPPKLKDMIMEGVGMEYDEGDNNPFDDPALRRNLCMTIGRLNSHVLNAHPDLISASKKGLVDQMYFKGNMEYRSKVHAFLELLLRISIALRNFELTKTIVQTMAIFKIGVASTTDEKSKQYYTDALTKQYGKLSGIPPTIEITNERIERVETKTEEEKPELVPEQPKPKKTSVREITGGEPCAIVLPLERKHAAAFTAKKLEICKKQGLPVELAMKSYRESWWILVRCKILSESTIEDPNIPNTPLSKIMKEQEGNNWEVFNSSPFHERLITAWPFVVNNVAQKSGEVKVQFKAPTARPGKYEISISIMSQEFMDADVDVSLKVTVLEPETKAPEEDNKKEEEEEDKKDK